MSDDKPIDFRAAYEAFKMCQPSFFPEGVHEAVCTALLMAPAKTEQPVGLPESGALSMEPERILELFWDAQAAFDHGDDVTQMLKFGEATDCMKHYFHQKANGELPVREISDERGIEEMAHKYWNDTNGWKANGEAWKHTREDNREYCREYVRKMYLPWVKSYLIAQTDIEDGAGK